jgi:hypothetical protein
MYQEPKRKERRQAGRGVSTWKAGKALSLFDRWSGGKTIKEGDEVRCLPKAGDPPLSSPSRACRSMAAFFLSLFSLTTPTVHTSRAVPLMPSLASFSSFSFG